MYFRNRYISLLLRVQIKEIKRERKKKKIERDKKIRERRREGRRV